MKTMIPKNPPKEIAREVQTLQRSLTDIMKHEGKFVLIRGEEVVNFFPSYVAATTEGYKRFGLEDFLVQEIQTRSEPIRAMRCGAVKMDGKLRLARPQKR